MVITGAGDASRRVFPVPPEELPRIRAILAGELAPAEPRPAVTVVLVRDGAAGLEVHLLRRNPRLAFAPGRYVFPGGSVDASDAEPVAWVGAAPPRPELVVAGVRETFEECGVLLAPGASPDATWEDERVALETAQTSLAAVLAARGLSLDARMLAPLAHWITPVSERRRFDTTFLLAALPPGQRTRDIPGEADLQVWSRPEEALAQNLPMLNPTRAVLRELAGETSAAEAFARPRIVETIAPEVRLVGDTLELVGRG